MEWTTELRDFVQKHIDDDTATLLLAAGRYPDIDVPFAVEQIEARRRLRDKLPEWGRRDDLVMGGRVPAEQCSSEVTARYKRGILPNGCRSLCDLTGGMGVDLWYMSEGLERAIYTERSVTLCEAARHNFSALADGHHPNVEVREGDGRTMPLPDVDVIYLDPARRATDGSRVFAIEQCEPNVVEWQDELLRHAPTVVVKLSPMVDVTDAVRRLRHVVQVHVVAVRGECKEVLVVMSADGCEDSPVCHCVDFLGQRRMDYEFNLADRGEVVLAQEGVGRYLYEPDVTLMKVGAFGSLCQRFGLSQLDRDTHLMTSDRLVEDFPGRIFEVEAVLPFSSRTLKRLRTAIPRANIATRNCPLTANELRRRTGIADGGDVYLFGARVNKKGDLLLKCKKNVVTLHT